MSQTIHSTSHKPGGRGILLGLYVHGDERGGNRSQNTHLHPHNNVRQYIYHPRFSQDDFHRGFQGFFFKKFIKDVAYTHIKMILIILIQACHHTLFVYLHIALLLLFMQLMELYTIRIYHPLDIYIIQNTFFLPNLCQYIYFLLIFILVHQL